MSGEGTASRLSCHDPRIVCTFIHILITWYVKDREEKSKEGEKGKLNLYLDKHVKNIKDGKKNYLPKKKRETDIGI